MKKLIWCIFCLVFLSCDNVLLPEEESLLVSLEENLAVPEQLDDGLITDAPENVAVDMTQISNHIKNIHKNKPNDGVRSLLIARNNKLVVEAYFNGWHRERKQDIRSATKSITSSLIGIGIDKGFLPDENARIFDFFDEYESFNHWDDRKADITIRDFLRMRTGLSCNDWSRTSVGNEELMYETKDWIKFVLDLPMSGEPGQRFSYCTGAPVTLGAILANASSKSIPEFAEENLFSHLGIADYEWEFMPSGRTDTGGHLHLRPRDMLKLGLLLLNNGTWNGKQIISQEWITKSTAPNGQAGNQEYGYLWWHHQWDIDGNIISTYFAWGNGGQHIFVLPQLNTVVVLTGGNYGNNSPGLNIIEGVILPSIQ